MKLTEENARAAAADAGNRSMRAAGRTTWNEEDYHTAASEYERLWPAGPGEISAVANSANAPPHTNGDQVFRRPGLAHS